MLDDAKRANRDRYSASVFTAGDDLDANGEGYESAGTLASWAKKNDIAYYAENAADTPAEADADETRPETNADETTEIADIEFEAYGDDNDVTTDDDGRERLFRTVREIRANDAHPAVGILRHYRQKWGEGDETTIETNAPRGVTVVDTDTNTDD